MNATDYQKAAQRTMTLDPDRLPHLLAVFGLGLVGEFGECIEHLDRMEGFTGYEMQKELGDLLWYVTAIASACGLSLVDLEGKAQQQTSVVTASQAQVAISAICDHLKKFIGHGDDLERLRVREGLAKVYAWIDDMAVSVPCSIEEVCDANIAKLLKRYPNGFGGRRGDRAEGK